STSTGRCCWPATATPVFPTKAISSSRRRGLFGVEGKRSAHGMLFIGGRASPVLCHAHLFRGDLTSPHPAQAVAWFPDQRGGAIMNKKVLLSAIAVTLLGSAAVFAAQAPAQPMSFFVTSTTPNGSGNLGGLAGADKI